MKVAKMKDTVINSDLEYVFPVVVKYHQCPHPLFDRYKYIYIYIAVIFSLVCLYTAQLKFMYLLYLL